MSPEKDKMLESIEALNKLNDEIARHRAELQSSQQFQTLDPHRLGEALTRQGLKELYENRGCDELLVGMLMSQDPFKAEYYQIRVGQFQEWEQYGEVVTLFPCKFEDESELFILACSPDGKFIFKKEEVSILSLIVDDKHWHI